MVGRLLPALLIFLAGCSQPPQEVAASAHEAVADVVVPAAEESRNSIAEALIPSFLEAQDAVEGFLAQAVPEVVMATPIDAVSPAAARLIVRWEVTSPETYTRKYQGLICPGGASGPTGGIGYDFGHQTATTIRRDWAGRPDVERLATASGVVGESACAAWVARNRDIRISYAEADRIFQGATLPEYAAAARRALSKGWDTLPPDAKGGNVSLGYNRGWSMRGDRNSEKRLIRDDCVPRGDLPCNAVQIRAMCRLWEGTPNGKGLCARRDAEASLIERAR